jgi:Holliday junction resolvase
MPTPSAAKGARGEREVVTMFRDAGFLQAQRSRAGAEEDRGDIASLPGLTVEIKNYSDIGRALREGLDELKTEKANNHTPDGVLFIKRRMKGWVAVMPAEDFVALWARIHGVSP